MHLKGLFVIQILALTYIAVVTLSQSASSVDSNPYERVIRPEVKFDGITLNATAFRLYSGQTLNFTFAFSTKGPAEASFVKNYTILADLTYEGVFKAYRNSFTYVDDIRHSNSYSSFAEVQVSQVSGHYVSTGSSNEKEISQILSPGEHKIEHIILFKIEGEAEGYMDINFLSEVSLTITESNSISLTREHFMLLGALIGAAGTFVGILLLKRNVIWSQKRQP